jgi:phosphoglycerate dehydrogenase-like enzyme
VDEDALADVLRRGAIAGAGLDVYSVEPLPPNDPIRSLPRTLLLPHIGYVTDDNYAQWYARTCWPGSTATPSASSDPGHPAMPSTSG